MSKEKKVFLCYLDDTDVKRSTFVYLVSKSNTTITFRTKSNIITIPFSRVLKLKEEIEGVDRDDNDS